MADWIRGIVMSHAVKGQHFVGAVGVVSNSVKQGEITDWLNQLPLWCDCVSITVMA